MGDCSNLAVQYYGSLCALNSISFEPRHEKTCHRGFRPGPTQTKLCVQSQKMTSGLKFRIQKVKGLYYLCRKTKGRALISCAITAQVVCIFVFAYAKTRYFFSSGSQCWYISHEPSSLYHHSVLVDLSVSMMMY